MRFPLRVSLRHVFVHKAWIAVRKLLILWCFAPSGSVILVIETINRNSSSSNTCSQSNQYIIVTRSPILNSYFSYTYSKEGVS